MIYMCMVFTHHFLHRFYRVPPALRSGLELLVFGDLSKVFIWCLYHMTGGLFYIWICGWADREHGAVKKNMVLLCFLQDMSQIHTAICTQVQVLDSI